MEKHIRRRFYLVPLLYVVIIFALISLQFSRVETREDKLMNIDIVSTTGKGAQGNALLRSLEVSYNGLGLLFTPGKQLTLITEDDIRHPLQLMNYSLKNQEMSIQFSLGTKLIIRPSSGTTRRVTLLCEIPETTPPVKTLEIPFRWDAEVNTEGPAENQQLISYSRGETNYYLNLPASSVLNIDSGRILLTAQEGQIGGLVAEETSAIDSDAYEYWYAQEKDSMTRDLRDTRVTEFIDKAYGGWKSSRFNTLNGKWRRGTLEEDFTEEAANAFLAEAFSRGYYTAAMNQVQAAALKNLTKLSWKSSPFLGDIVKFTKERQQEDRRDVAQMEEYLKAGRREIFDRDDLFLFVQTRGLDAYNRRLFQIAAQPVRVDEPIERAVNLLQFYADALKYNKAPENSAALCEDIIENRIMPAIVRTSQGLFLTDSQGQADLLLSVRAGEVMAQLGPLMSLDVVQPVGWKLTTSAVLLGNREGLMPRSLDLTNPEDPRTQGTLTPETLYPWIKDNPYYPHIAWFENQLGQNYWAWTVSDFREIQQQDRRMTFVMDYPQGKIHHLAIHNVPSFDRLYLHTIPWNTDPRFQRWSEGWSYTEETGTLYIKIKHRTFDEAIRLLMPE